MHSGTAERYVALVRIDIEMSKKPNEICYERFKKIVSYNVNLLRKTTKKQVTSTCVLSGSHVLGWSRGTELN